MKFLRIPIGYLLVMASAFAPSCGYPQQQKIDSLQSLIQNNAGISKYAPLISLVRLHGAVNNNTVALDLAREARQLAFQAADTAKIVQSSRITGQLLIRSLMYKEAEAVLTEAMPIAYRHNLRDDYATVLMNLALTATFFAKYDKALDLNFQALRIRQQDQDDDGAASSLTNIGFLYYKLSDCTRALQYFTQAMDLRKKLNDEHERGSLLVNVGFCYIGKKDFPMAKVFADSALTFCEHRQCDEVTRANIYLCLGKIHLGLKQLGKAEDYLKRCYVVVHKSNNLRLILDNAFLLSEVYQAEGKTSTALYYLEVAEELARDDTQFRREILMVYAQLARLYSSIRNHKKLTHYQQKYIQLRDSVYNEELTANLMKVEAVHVEKQNQAQIAAQNEILALKDSAIKRQSLLNLLIGVVAAMAVLLTIILFRSNRQKQRINAILDERVRERTRQIEENRKVLIGTLNERNMTMEKTSDQLKKTLASIKGLCEVGLLDVDDPVATRHCIDGVMVMSDQLALRLGHFQQDADSDIS